MPGNKNERKNDNSICFLLLIGTKFPEDYDNKHLNFHIVTCSRNLYIQRIGLYLQSLPTLLVHDTILYCHCLGSFQKLRTLVSQ